MDVRIEELSRTEQRGEGEIPSSKELYAPPRYPIKLWAKEGGKRKKERLANVQNCEKTRPNMFW